MRTWSTGDCKCKIEELYQGDKITGHGQVINKCPIHAAVPDSELYDYLLRSENMLKNLIKLYLEDKHPEKVQAYEEGGYSFTGQGRARRLKIHNERLGPALTPQQKTDLKNFLAQRAQGFGVNYDQEIDL